MNKKRNIRTIAIVALVAIAGVGYLLISPLWRNKSLDEPLTGSGAAIIEDNLEAMDVSTRAKFDQEVRSMQGKPSMVTDAMPATQTQPKILSQGMFKARSHEVEGKALLVQAGDQKIVRFEDFKTVNGPDLRIYLSAGLSGKDYVDLGAIRATEGNINYMIPAGTDTEKYRYVLVWCRTFGVLFSYAEL